MVCWARGWPDALRRYPVAWATRSAALSDVEEPSSSSLSESGGRGTRSPVTATLAP